MRRERTTSIKGQMIGLVLSCWILPILLIMCVLGQYVVSRQNEHVIRQNLSQLEMDNKICAERLRGAISASRDATYDRTLGEEYRKYIKGDSTYVNLYSQMKYYLTRRYGKSEEFSNVMLWLYEDPRNKNTAVFNEVSGGSYNQIQNYWKSDHEKVLSVARNLDTSIGFLYRDGRLYLLRNLVDSSYHPWSVLIMRVNMDYCFETLLSAPEEKSVLVRLDGQDIYLLGTREDFAKMPKIKPGKKSKYVSERQQIYSYQKVKIPDHEMITVEQVSNSTLGTPIYGYRYILAGMFFMLVPILLVLVKMFRKSISGPIDSLVMGASEIEKGNLGYQLAEDAGNAEFDYLLASFNKMSQKLKYQFDHIYEEELALRDAKIMALQSHINPHFMNNTLEIINWEARLSGNSKVSKMIESLSILMDAAMDRRKQPVIALSEEMIYVNAYLHITSERLGKRLRVIKDLPQEIMEEKVPRLILQPIIENAIEHGVVPKISGTVSIRGWREGNYLYLETENDGGLTPGEMAKVERLLSPDYDTSQESSGNLGIANVNQRLRILYGDECGLQMFCKDNNTHVVSRLIIRINRD